jgi:hypothetical protein
MTPAAGVTGIPNARAENLEGLQQLPELRQAGA